MCYIFVLFSAMLLKVSWQLKWRCNWNKYFMESDFVLLAWDLTFLYVNNLNFPVLFQAKKLPCLLGLQAAHFKLLQTILYWSSYQLEFLYGSVWCWKSSLCMSALWETSLTSDTETRYWKAWGFTQHSSMKPQQRK